MQHLSGRRLTSQWGRNPSPQQVASHLEDHSRSRRCMVNTLQQTSMAMKYHHVDWLQVLPGWSSKQNIAMTDPPPPWDLLKKNEKFHTYLISLAYLEGKFTKSCSRHPSMLPTPLCVTAKTPQHVKAGTKTWWQGSDTPRACGVESSIFFFGGSRWKKHKISIGKKLRSPSPQMWRPLLGRTFLLQTKTKLVNPTQSSSKGFFRDYGSGVPSNGS